jgi:hypothetical protein
MHRDLYGVDAARDALEKSVTELTRERARYIEQRLVAGDPAQALLDTVGVNPAYLIVVGNRGLGASEGQLLGSVPAGVVRNAVCNVLVVQTSALDEDRYSPRSGQPPRPPTPHPSRKPTPRPPKSPPQPTPTENHNRRPGSGSGANSDGCGQWWSRRWPRSTSRAEPGFIAAGG